MKLSKYFTLSEMIKSQAAIRKGIDNMPSPDETEALKALCENVLDYIRVRYNKPVMVNSGFRSKKVNTLIGGSKNSQHTKGEAADIEIPGVDNLELAYWIVDNLDFDQLISEFYEPGDPQSGWVHISWNRNGNRKQVLTINKSGTKSGLPPKKEQK